MSTARILIRQGTAVYRFMRFETSSDGSLVILVDRDPRLKRGGMSGRYNSNEEAIFTPDDHTSDRPVPSYKFSAHTTGIVHRYAAGKRKSTVQIEPLYALTKLWTIGVVYPYPESAG
jgi:hypothetical protein